MKNSGKIFITLTVLFLIFIGFTYKPYFVGDTFPIVGVKEKIVLVQEDLYGLASSKNYTFDSQTEKIEPYEGKYLFENIIKEAQSYLSSDLLNKTLPWPLGMSSSYKTGNGKYIFVVGPSVFRQFGLTMKSGHRSLYVIDLQTLKMRQFHWENINTYGKILGRVIGIIK